MKKVLVLGDQITDTYRHFTATRICPEGPVPVLTKTQEKYATSGGAGLVVAQLTELFGDNHVVTFIPGSHSEKERIFADDRLMLRIDSDSEYQIVPAYIFDHKLDGYDAIIVSDYDKGAFIEPTAQYLMLKAAKTKTPVFVDAKKNWLWYSGAFAAFPNRSEAERLKKENPEPHADRYMAHWIVKNGPEGCKVDGVHIPTKNHAVRDVTGAGDCFLAAFVYEYLNWSGRTEKDRLLIAARFANKVAGISVEYVGTHIVTQKELDERSDL